MTDDTHVTRKEAQSEIDGLVVAEIIRDFGTNFQDIYPDHILARGVGPEQAFIGLAIRRGHLRLPRSCPCGIPADVHMLCSAGTCDACTQSLRDRLVAAQAEIVRLQQLLIEEREETLWNAFNSGHTKDGQWSHGFMSDGEHLAAECGLDPTEAWYPVDVIKAAIPEVAKRAILTPAEA